MILFNCERGPIVQRAEGFFQVEGTRWDDLINAADLPQIAKSTTKRVDSAHDMRPPVTTQEVWAAGVTYLRSREARKDEVKASGAGDGDFYARVYDADRPELFFKSVPRRVVGTGEHVRIRRDSKWQVPEPELAVVINSRGDIVGWTIGNDMSARDIEGANPLYLPQAKTWDGSCALGPGVVLGQSPGPQTLIAMTIHRDGGAIFEGSTTLARMKRQPEELGKWLFRECTFPTGVVLLTGTGIVPPDDFTLQVGDEIRITIDGAGTLVNHVSMGSA